jgi:excinuclease UvrABC ATPase subunit
VRAGSHEVIRVHGARVNNLKDVSVVFEGTPADLVAARSTLTGQHLAAYVAA